MQHGGALEQQRHHRGWIALVGLEIREATGQGRDQASDIRALAEQLEQTIELGCPRVDLEDPLVCREGEVACVRPVARAEHARRISQVLQLRGGIADHARELVARLCPRDLVLRACRDPAERFERAQITGLRLEHGRDDRPGLAQPPRDLERLGAVELPRRACGRIVGQRAAQLEHLRAREQRIDDRADVVGVRVDLRRHVALGEHEERAGVVGRGGAGRGDALVREIEVPGRCGERGGAHVERRRGLGHLHRRGERVVRSRDARRIRAARGDERCAEQGAAPCGIERGRRGE